MKPGVQRIGKYELQKRLGSGKMGEVWTGYDARLQRPVTIKLFAPPQSADSETMAQFRRSTEQIAALQHSGIAHIYDLFLSPSNDPTGPSASLVCLVTEYVEGQSVADYMQSTASPGKMSQNPELLQFFTSVSQAVDYAHQHGIIHGNLKPSNIILRGGRGTGLIGDPVLTDFGFVKLLKSVHATTSLLYLSPEQIRGGTATERSDIYSLGVMLYELCTGVLPFRGNRPIAIMVQQLNTPPTPPALLNPTISSSLSAVILQSLEKEPEKRFPSTMHMTVALARALQAPFPRSLSHDKRVPEILRSLDASSVQHPHSAAGLALFSASTSPQHKAVGGEPLAQETAPSLLANWKRKGTKRANVWYTLIFIVLLIAALGTLGTLFLLPQQSKGVVSDPLVGHAFFLNSGQITTDSPRGINDELQVVLPHIAAPPAGKRYYAWLLADASVSESLPLALGPLSLNHGTVQFLYHGDDQHTNLLGVASRFLITVDDASNPTSNPLVDPGTWRYYAEIPAEPIPGDQLHFSLLAHLRHLLVESPELQVRGLHGGLAFWFVRNTLTVMQLASDARDDWNGKDLAGTHDQIVRLLDFVDGASFVHTDVPAGTSLLADPRLTQVALLGPAPRNPDPPGYGYNDEVSPGYVYLLSEHMSGAVRSSQTTADQRKLAIQINKGLDEATRLLEQIEQDAKQLVQMSRAQLGQPSTLSILNDLATQTENAYAGQLDPTTGQSTNGALWIYQNIQRLATFDIRPYKAAGQ